MMSLTSVQRVNQELADRLMTEARQNPPSGGAGQFVGIANGQVVVVTNDLNELVRRLNEVEPDTRKTCCIEPGRDLSKFHEIWDYRAA